MELAQARETYRWATEVHAQAGAPDRFRIVRSNSDADPAEQYLELLSGA